MSSHPHDEVSWEKRVRAVRRAKNAVHMIKNGRGTLKSVRRELQMALWLLEKHDEVEPKQLEELCQE